MGVSIFYTAALLLSFLFSASARNVRPAPSCGYNSCPVPKPGMLNVHIISHTHLDVGWLKTVDQLYYGSQQYIQNAGVQYILDSVVGALLKDPNRKFIQVETAFFKEWWDNQSPTTQNSVHKLVQSGQLEFIGGGWCMNDEGGAHYNAIVDQMTYGLRFLSDLFGQCGVPKVGWQIDPFGHSREQASLFAQMGFDGLFLGRIDHEDKDKRESTHTMEMVWNASANLANAQLFTGVLYNTYSPPSGFCFDLLCSDEPIIDNPKSRDYNVDRRVDQFLKAMQHEALSYATNNIPVTMGNDFNYQQADSWFINIDRLIKYSNERQADGSKVNVFYSTPSCYLNALNQAKKTWPTKSDDFFPYSNNIHSYWTGYFTSRPALKGYIRQNNNFLQACKQLDLLTGFSPESKDRLTQVNVLKESMAVAQHHDAVSGTAKQAVTDDYMERLYDGVLNCERVVDDSYKNLLPLGSKPVPQQLFCHKLNVSECDVSENEDGFTVTVYNPFGQQVTVPVRLPSTKTSYVVGGPNNEHIDYKFIPISRSIIDLAERDSVATWEILFMATIPPFGFQTYFVNNNETVQPNNIVPHDSNHIKRHSKKSDMYIENQNVRVVVDGATGFLKTVINLKEMVSVPIEQNFMLYDSMAKSYIHDSQASGAYIFRNNGTARNISTSVSVQTFKSTLVQEIHQRFNSWVSQVIRLYDNSEHVEFDWVVGPIPVEDGVGKEIITRFDAKNMKTNGIFYTDSNGREMLERRLNYRPTWKLNVTEPIAGNYYPVNSRIYLKDTNLDVQMTLLTDRSVGGSSLEDGSLELMLHRRMLFDDSFGVGEALNEPGTDGKGLVVRGKTLLHVGHISTAAAAHRIKALQVLMAPQISFSVPGMEPSDYKNAFRTSYCALKSPLPANVHILTFERVSLTQAILRLEHFFEKGEDSTLSREVFVDVSNLFYNFTITSMEEMTLGANQKQKDNSRLQWSVDTNQIPEFETRHARAGDGVDDDPTQIRLKPMEIRTFLITFEKPPQEALLPKKRW